jgi:hypothetical protein
MVDIHTPASTNGLLNHSFHQNCLSTLLHSGRVGYGSASGSTLSGPPPPPLPLNRLGLEGALGLAGRVWLLWGFGLRDGEVGDVLGGVGGGGGGESGRALREAKSAFCFWDLATCACLCCNDLVISSPIPNKIISFQNQFPNFLPRERTKRLTEIISEVHSPLRKLLNCLPHDLILQLALAFFGSWWGRGGCV